MRLSNASLYPDAEVRALVAFAMKGANTRGIYVKVKNTHLGAIGGMAYGVPNISPITNLKTVRALVTLRLGPPERFPATNFGHPYGGKRSPLIEMADWREGLVALAAHEARRVWQADNGKPGSEVDAERFAAKRLAAYRAQADKKGPA